MELVGQDGALELCYAVNTEKLAQAKALDGKYLLGTAQRALTADEMMQRAKMRDGVEKRIELFKGLLQVRPIYVQTEERIRGLVFLTLVALLVFSILELQLRRAHQPQTGRAVLERFQTLRAVYLMFRDGSSLRRAGQADEFQSGILGALGLPSPQIYLDVGC